MPTTKKVYLFRAAQFYKIGISCNHESRLKQIQTGCPIKVEYIGCFQVANPEKFERILHIKFANDRTFGEWFNFSDDHIRILIAEHNLKHIINPYTTINEQTEITAATPALNKVRQLAADIQEIDKVYQGLYPGWKMSDEGRVTSRKIISKYGKLAVIEGMTRLSEKFDEKDVWINLHHAARTFKEYGRHINDETWNAYYSIKGSHSVEIAREFLSFIMKNNLDNERSLRLLLSEIYSSVVEPEYLDDWFGNHLELIKYLSNPILII